MRDPKPDSLPMVLCYFVFFVRDPNFDETLSTFENSVQWAAEGKFTDQDIEEAKISCLAQVSIKRGNEVASYACLFPRLVFLSASCCTLRLAFFLVKVLSHAAFYSLDNVVAKQLTPGISFQRSSLQCFSQRKEYYLYISGYLFYRLVHIARFVVFILSGRLTDLFRPVIVV